MDSACGNPLLEEDVCLIHGKGKVGREKALCTECNEEMDKEGERKVALDLLLISATLLHCTAKQKIHTLASYNQRANIPTRALKKKNQTRRMSWFPVIVPPFSEALPFLPPAVVCPVPGFDQCHAFQDATSVERGPHVTCTDFMSDQRICGIALANGRVAAAHYVLTPSTAKETIDHVIYTRL